MGYFCRHLGPSLAGYPLRNRIEHASEYSRHRIGRLGIYPPSPISTGWGLFMVALIPLHFRAAEKAPRAPVKILRWVVENRRWEAVSVLETVHHSCGWTQVGLGDTTHSIKSIYCWLGTHVFSLPKPCLTNVNMKEICVNCKAFLFSSSSTPFLMNKFQTLSDQKLLALSRMPQNKRNFTHTLVSHKLYSVSTSVCWLLLWKRDPGFHQMKEN